MQGPGALRGQKRTLDILELELLMVVSCHVDAGNRTQSLSAKATSALKEDTKVQ
ncbi:hypothetical protein I79_008363 [Cricetulus griseus]|uniref:Uncharacterized protein n=1 Tax=Cricetulus griseus TaxID=10029 RepID=G3HCZ5_CRIGR|nr:hypothetical protein I79_008363 [Cricetulus griseus]